MKNQIRFSDLETSVQPLLAYIGFTFFFSVFLLAAVNCQVHFKDKCKDEASHCKKCNLPSMCLCCYVLPSFQQSEQKKCTFYEWLEMIWSFGFTFMCFFSNHSNGKLFQIKSFYTFGSWFGWINSWCDFTHHQITFIVT